MSKTIAPYGSWQSPVTTDLIIQGGITLNGIHGDGGRICWIESRPQERGRCVLVERNSHTGQNVDVSPSPINVRNRVHEYGGAACLVTEKGLFYSNFTDNRLYFQANGSKDAVAITHPETQHRFADGVYDKQRNLLYYVREDHSVVARGLCKEPMNTIVAIHLDTPGDIKDETVLASGHDFYASPRLSHSGSKLAFVCWNHPNMPWDNTELCTVDIGAYDRETRILEHSSHSRCIAGSGNESIMQPVWSPEDDLYFISDRRDGWWNIHRYDRDTHEISVVIQRDCEVGGPAWTFGSCDYLFLTNDKLLVVLSESDGQNLAIVDLNDTSSVTYLKTEGYTAIRNLTLHNSDTVYFIAGGPTRPLCIVEYNLTTQVATELKVSQDVSSIDSGYFSIPKMIEFPTTNGRNAYAYFYPPTNKDFDAPSDEKPPLLVRSHGGPTAAASTVLNLRTVQYWTSRGFAVVDVDYSGSTGYGRAYRQRLNGQWGEADLDDCCYAAKYLGAQGLVDERRMAITGGSAGGYTTLACLAFRQTFAAGVSHYGICDLEMLTKDTHKFEGHYTDTLIGKYPEQKHIFVQRSPIHFVDRLSTPIALFQGDEDAVVPPNQAVVMYEAVKKKGIPVSLVLFKGEQHGWRQASTIKRALEGELYFYSKIFNFVPAEANSIEPIPIDNLSQ